MHRIMMLVILLAPALAAAAQQQAPDVSLSWSVGLDEKGAITSLEAINPEYMPALQTRLEPAIRTWHFTTGKINGQPAPTQTTLTLKLAFESAGDGDYHVRLRTLGTGATYEHLVRPLYPEFERRTHRDGFVMLKVDYDADGRITSATPVEGATPKPTTNLVRSAMAAAKQSKFKPERIAGHGVPGSAMMPICFSISSRAQRSCLWKRDGEDRPLNGDGPIALTSVVQIDTDVVGSTL
jgi:TonB family protein